MMVTYRGDKIMRKEIIIVLLIIVIIFATDIITQNFTKNSISVMNEKLDNIKTYVINNDINNLNLEIQDLNEKWTDINNKMSFYIEHDELEKVNSSLVKFKSYIELEEYSEAVPEIDECKYILDHIKEKQRLKIINLF